MMNYEEILWNSVNDPDKQKTLPYIMQNMKWFNNGVMRALIRHFAYWLEIELKNKKV